MSRQGVPVIDQQVVRDGHGVIHRRLVISGRAFSDCRPEPCELLPGIPWEARDADLCLICFQPRRSDVPEVD